MGRRTVGERGGASVELAIAVPALLLMLLLVVQFALWYHASHVVTAAAQQGLTAAQHERGSSAAGNAAAWGFLHAAGRRVVESAEVAVTRGADVTEVEVRGFAVAVVPGFHLPVSGHADGPSERFRSRLER